MAESEEKSSKKMKTTTEHGQILMTIQNLFHKCKQRKELVVAKGELMNKDSPENFNDMQASGTNAISQLIVIQQCLENFIKLKDQLDTKSHIKEAIQKKKENNEIV